MKKIKLVALTEDVVEQLERLAKKYADEDTDKPLSYNKTIRKVLKLSGLWIEKNQSEGHSRFSKLRKEIQTIKER